MRSILKGIFAIALIIAPISSSYAQYVPVSADIARAVIHINPSCAILDSTGGQSQLDTTCPDLLSIHSLILYNDLTGVEYLNGLDSLSSTAAYTLFAFPSSLRYLNLQSPELYTLPPLPDSLNTFIYVGNIVPVTPFPSVLPSSLVYLDCSNNNFLSSLPPLPPSLTYLNCRGNEITPTLPSLPPSLRYLSCGFNFRLTSLPTLPPTLTYLYCANDSLTALPLLPSVLDTLICNENSISGLQSSLPDSLRFFNCAGNYHIRIMPPLPALLGTLICNYDSLQTMPALPPTLTYLDCSANQIPTLPSLPSSLIKLICGGYPMTNLPVLPAALKTLDCSANGISTIPVLPASLKTLNCTGNPLYTLPILPTGLDTLFCADDSLSSLLPFPGSLKFLDCNNNQLSHLPSLPVTLKSIICYQNHLLDLPSLPDSISLLNCSYNHQLSCLPPCGFAVGLLLFIDSTNIQCLPNPMPLGTIFNSIYLPLCGSGFNPGGCTYLPDGYVWPGDADANHLVDNNDLLPIGLAYDSTGPARAAVSIVWQADSAADWTHYFTSMPTVNFNHADCNGDGMINADDTLAIIQNFSLTHAKTNGSSTPWRSGLSSLRTVLSADSIYAGDTLTVTFMLGDSANPVSNIYGLAYTYNFDPTVVDSTFTGMSYSNSWLGNSTDAISISKPLSSTGQIKTAFTRIDHASRSGYGPIATAKFKITTDNISGKDLSYYTYTGYISDVTAMNQNGTLIQLNTGADTAQIGYTPNVIKEIASERVSMYPNPTHDKVTISANNIINDIVVTDVTGREIIHQTNVGRKSATMDVSACEDGLYTVRVKTAKGAGIVKLIVTK